jgi:hypothetical protein
MTKVYKTSNPTVLATALDEIILQGGSWQEIANECNKHAIKLFKTTRYTRGGIEAHITYREIKDPNYLGKYTRSDWGIELAINSTQTITKSKQPSKIVRREHQTRSEKTTLRSINKVNIEKIIRNAVEKTRPRWLEYSKSWNGIDVDFILQGYEQQGFQFFKMKPVLEELNILSIDQLGSFLLKYPGTIRYDRDFAGSLNSKFYLDLKGGICGLEGKFFAEAVRRFLDEKMGSPGRTFWKLLFQMLQASAFLKQNYSSSFAKFVIAKYAKHTGNPHITEHDFLNLSSDEWDSFLKKSKPWKDLMGIGPNVFDFIMGDTIEAKFVMNSYKFDSANQHFLEVTGIAQHIVPFNRVNTVTFLKSLNLHYPLREINKGLYTFCSKTESELYGYCYNLSSCRMCNVENICAKNLS